MATRNCSFCNIDLVKLTQAISFAADAHRRQYRKDKDRTPYFNHPAAVAEFLARAGVRDHEVLMAAYLHDTVEDTPATIETISSMFGDRVASIVAEVTDDKSLSKRKRKELQIQNAPHKSIEAKTVKLGDKLHNLLTMSYEPPQGWDNDRIRGYYAWAYEVVAGLRGTNAKLETALDQVFITAKCYNSATQQYELIFDPAADNSALLSGYLESMDGVKIN
jgi:guanosine-3',5'-bis(diphosphate) 3'-pyrophosphohydrolase